MSLVISILTVVARQFLRFNDEFGRGGEFNRVERRFANFSRIGIRDNENFSLWTKGWN